jgi:hypothetical protein
MTGFIDTLFTELGTTGNTALLLFYTLYRSPLHTHYGSQSSLVVSWQRISNTLSLQITRVVFFAGRNSFLAIILQLPALFNSSAPKLISRQAGVSKLDSQLVLCCWTRLYSHSARAMQKTQHLLLKRRVYWSVAYQWMSYYCPLWLQRECVYRIVA